MIYKDWTKENLKELDAEALLDALEQSAMAFCWYSIHNNAEERNKAIASMGMIREEMLTQFAGK